MRRLAKKLVASAVALTLTVGMCTTAFGAAWGSYFGQPDWYEGAEGTLSDVSDTGWTATMNMLGWGGVWGGQVYQDAAQGTSTAVKVEKGKKYTISFTMSSSNCTKYVYFKVSTGEVIAFHDWVALKKGQNVNYSKTFTAANDATTIYFAIGGDYGDRETSESNALVRYGILPDYATVLKEDGDGDPTAATIIKLSKFSLGEAKAATPAKPAKVKIKSFKPAKGSATVKFAKAKNAAGYQVKYKIGKKTTTKDIKKKTSYKIKAKKGTKITVQVRAYATGKKTYGSWSTKKKATTK